MSPLTSLDSTRIAATHMLASWMGGRFYRTFRVTSPTQDEAIRDNAGNVTIRLSLQPGLRSGDTIDISLDGRRVGSGDSTTVHLAQVDRGTHTVRATIRDANGQVVARTDGVTFHLLRVAVGRAR